MLTPLELPVQPHENHPQHRRRADGDEARDAVVDERRHVLRAGALGVQVTRVDAGAVGHGVDECER